MKFIVCLLLVVILALVQAQPLAFEAEQLQEQGVDAALLAADAGLGPSADLGQETVDSTAGHRQKRATCDLLSVWNVNHAACAAHCLTKGFKGGYCNGKAVCVCRR